MPSTHILNGDGMAGAFRTSGIDGNIIIWREGFALGPVSYHFNNKEFFNRRKQFWNQYRQVVTNDPIPVYDSHFIPEIEKINRIGSLSDIYLWFEYDLFCQVNMIALLSLIHQGQKGKNIYLVPVNDQLIGHPQASLEDATRKRVN